MAKSLFDLVATNFDEFHQAAVKPSGYPSSYFHEQKVKETHRALSKFPGFSVDTPVILDFGCGVGTIDPYLRKYFPYSPIYAVDISTESIKVAQEKHEALVPCKTKSLNNRIKSFELDTSIFGSKLPIDTLLIFVSFAMPGK